MTVYANTTQDGPGHSFTSRLMCSTSLGYRSGYGWGDDGGRYWATVGDSSSQSGLKYLIDPTNSFDTGVSGVDVPTDHNFSKVPDADGSFFDFSKFAYIYYDNADWKAYASVSQYVGYPWSVPGIGVWSWKVSYYFREVIGFLPPPNDNVPVFQNVQQPEIQEGTVTLSFDGVTDGESSKYQIGSVPAQANPPSAIGDRVIRGVSFDNFKCLSFQFNVPIEQMFQ